jgi:phosphonate transport system substrate-binding protein
MICSPTVGLILIAMMAAATARGADINFTVQPIIDRAATQKAYQPLADYIAKTSGKSVEFKTSYDYADYWLAMKVGKAYNLILDGPFYTDWRIKNQGYIPLVKVPGVVSYSLVCLSSAGILETSELVGKRIASLIPPAPGGLVMARMFPIATRQPYIIPVRSSERALELLLSGKADAAMVPTPLVAQAMSQGKEISTVATSDQTPHIALSAAPSIDAATRDKIKQALLNADKTPAGQAMLKHIGFDGFEATTAEVYNGYAKYLEQDWGAQ